MREQIQDLNLSLKRLHRRFLENELLEAEKKLERRLSSFDFLSLLVNNSDFTWLRPFSALIAEIDAFLSEAENIERSDLNCIQEQVLTTILRSTQLQERFETYKAYDGEFIMAYSQFHRSLTAVLSAQSAVNRPQAN